MRNRVEEAVKAAVSVLKEAVAEWRMDDGPRLSAALAYHAIFSVPAVLLLAISVIAPIYGEKQARAELFTATKAYLGPGLAKALGDVLASAAEGRSKITLLGVIVLLWAASGVFVQLSRSFSYIFRCEEAPAGGWLMELQHRAIGIVTVILIGGVLMVLLFSGAFLTLIEERSAAYVDQAMVGRSFETISTLVVAFICFALFYKWLPHKRQMSWTPALAGGAFSGAVFTILKLAFGTYISKANPSSAFGAAGSLVLVLLLVYFGAQVFFFGAEICKVVLERGGQKELELVG